MDPDQYYLLKDAVRRYLDEVFQVAVTTGGVPPWPTELAEMVGWIIPENIGY